MQQQKDNLTAQANDTAAQQRALQEEAAGVKLALGNITSSLHQLALTDASPSPQPGQTQLDQTRPISHTTEVSSDSTCRALMECEVLLCNIIESFSPDGAGLIAARIWGAHYGSCNEAHIEVSVAFIFLESGQLTPLHFHFFFLLDFTFGKERGTLIRHRRDDSGRICCSWGYMLFQRRVINHCSISEQTKHRKISQTGSCVPSVNG